MYILPQRAKIPVKSLSLVGMLLLLTLVVWVQKGTSLNHFKFLICNYVTWWLALPFVYDIARLDDFITIAQKTKKIIRILIIIVVHFIVSNILYYSLNSAIESELIIPSFEEFQSFLGPSILSRVTDIGLILGIFFFIRRNDELNRNNVKLLITEKNLKEAKLQALKNQLNPHFLFNSLHAVSSLIGYDDDKAREMTIKISQFLRTSLQINQKESHSLREELQLINNYLDIEKERFHDRLSIEIKVDKSIEDVEIPTMTLQPLVENAFKHGIARLESKGQIEIKVEADPQGGIYLKITNDIPSEGKIKDHSNDSGLGLINLKERLLAFYNKEIELNLFNDEVKHQYTATLKLPTHEV